MKVVARIQKIGNNNHDAQNDNIDNKRSMWEGGIRESEADFESEPRARFVVMEFVISAAGGSLQLIP